MSQKNMGRLAQDMKRELIALIGQQALLVQLRFEGGQGGKVEQGGEAGFARAAAHLAVVGFIAQKQADGIEGDGFAGSGFAGEHGEAGLEIEVELLDDYKVVQGECQQHG